jgi:heme exporter protein CcmD
VTLPLAHAGHYAWTIYIVPFLVVLWAIGRSIMDQRRAKREEQDRS